MANSGSKLKKKKKVTRTLLKNWILVQDRGEAEFLTGGILLYVEDLKRGSNKDIGPKDIFEMDSKFDRSTAILYNFRHDRPQI